MVATRWSGPASTNSMPRASIAVPRESALSVSRSCGRRKIVAGAVIAGLLDVQAGARGSAQPGSGSPPRSIGSDHAEARGGLAARQVAAAGGVAAAGAVAGAEVAVAVAGRARRGGLGLGGGTGGVDRKSTR